MKTERVVFLATPQFKARLQAEARREGVGVAELIRRRVEGQPSGEEALLIELTKQLRHAVAEARESVSTALAESEAILGEIRARREARERLEQSRLAA